jgi:hypothetical protein
MQLVALRRWHWIAIAIIVGAIIGLVRKAADGPIYGLNTSYGMLLTDQREFENALVSNYQGTPLFYDPVVYPHWTTDASGNSQLVYVVGGNYWDGHTQENGLGQYMKRCFITKTPYRPQIGIVEGSAPVVEEYPSVVQFLAALNRVYGIKYRYAWWAAYPVLTWVTGCLVVIGGIWPTLINLLAFGRFTRPPEAKALSLWSIRKPKTPEPAKSLPTDFNSTAESPEAPNAAPTAADTVDSSAPISILAADPLAPAPQTPQSSTEFDAKPDDFYPTERRGPSPESKQAKLSR